MGDYVLCGPPHADLKVHGKDTTQPSDGGEETYMNRVETQLP